MTSSSSISPSEFQITDEIYQDFVNYLKDKDCSYKTGTEQVLKELRDIAKDENYIDALSSQIDALEEQLKKDKDGDLTKFRDEISEMLKAEILVRYYYAAGRLEGSLVSDPEVKKAIEVLKDKELYAKALRKK